MKNKTLKAILQALMIAVAGGILLNATFMLDFAWQSLIRFIFVRSAPSDEITLIPFFLHISFLLLIALISWFIYHSKLGSIYKATYIMVPTAVILVTLGIFLYRWPVLSYGIGAILSLGVLYAFYRKKLSWFYYFSVIFVAITLLIMGLTGQKI